MSKKASVLLKPLDHIHKLLTTRQPKTKYIEHQPESVDRMTNLILTQMITSKSPQYGNETLKLFGEILYEFSSILLKNDQPLTLLKEFQATHKKDHGQGLFTISATTLNQTLGKIRPSTADTVLSEATTDIEYNLRKQGLWTSEQILALDPSHTRFYGKHVNRFHNWGSIGQKPLYLRTFKEVAVYASTPQLIMGGAIEPVLPKNKSQREFPIWMTEVQNQVLHLHETKNRVKCIYGDREYYSSLAMIYSYFGLWNLAVPPDANPRFVVPKKMWGDKEGDKWSYLLIPDSPEILKGQIELDYYFNKFIGEPLKVLQRKPNQTRYLIPTWIMAVFDTYGNGKELRTLDWGKNEARRLEARLQEARHTLKAAESEYGQYLLTHPATHGKIPTYRGMKKRKFQNTVEEQLYLACWSANNSCRYWETQKTNLSKRLIFFMVSSRPNERPERCLEEIRALVQGYHERWGVESCFKDIKYKFLIKTNSRKPSDRHVRFVLSALVYNAWHYYRLLRIARISRKRRKKWKPYWAGKLIRRKKYERKQSTLLDAGSFTHSLLRLSLLLTLQRVITKIC